MSDVHSDLIAQLAIPHRAKAAYGRLLAIGPVAMPAVREGLRHESADVRGYCCRFLDHFVETQSFDALVAMLDDADAQVRAHAMHALACDRCKEGDCRPDEGQVLPMAMDILARDPDPFVRAMAVEVVGASVHARPEAEDALATAIARDPSPAVRKKARWFAPGGPIYKRTAPKPARRARA